MKWPQKFFVQTFGGTSVLPLLFSFTLRRGRCSCGGSADLSALCKCAVLLATLES